MRLSSTTTRMRKGNGDKRGDRDICDDPRKDLDGFNIMLYTGILVYPCLYPWFRKSKITKHATLCTPPFAKFSRKERYSGNVLAATKVLVQAFPSSPVLARDLLHEK